jgi:hypothetical protein
MTRDYDKNDRAYCMITTQNCRIRTVYCMYLTAIIVFYKFHFYQKKVRPKKIRSKDVTQTTVIYLLRKEKPIVLRLPATIRLSHFGREFGKKRHFLRCQ